MTNYQKLQELFFAFENARVLHISATGLHNNTGIRDDIDLSVITTVANKSMQTAKVLLDFLAEVESKKIDLNATYNDSQPM